MLLAPDFAIYFYIAGSVSVTILRVSLANPYGAMVKERPLGRTCPIFLGADFCPHGCISYLTRVESKIKINTEAWEDGLAGKALVNKYGSALKKTEMGIFVVNRLARLAEMAKSGFKEQTLLQCIR